MTHPGHRRRRDRAIGRLAAVVTPLAAAATLVACGGGGRNPGPSSRPPSLAEGRAVFVSAGCGGCHTLSAAGTHGTLGPNFDTSERLDAAQVRQQLDVGAGGMPSYEGRLTERERRAVSAFVAATMR